MLKGDRRQVCEQEIAVSQTKDEEGSRDRCPRDTEAGRCDHRDSREVKSESKGEFKDARLAGGVPEKEYWIGFQKRHSVLGRSSDFG